MANKRNKNKKRVRQPQTQRTGPSHLERLSGQQVQVQESSFSGPIPPPEMLKKYFAVDGTLPGRFVEMAEKDQDYVIDISKKSMLLNEKMISGQIAAERRGQWFAFLICLVTVGGGIYLMGIGVRITGFILTISTLAGLAYTFITGRKRNTPKQQTN